MVATTMPPIRELLSQLSADYPTVSFVAGNDFKWSQTAQTLTYTEDDSDASLYLLHELAHALLGHGAYQLDIELLAQEREAWESVRSHLAPRYNVAYDDQAVENALDTYRNWLHARSLCPSCGLTGLQTKTSIYTCVNCRCSWRPNDARRCALRRYTLASRG